MTDNYFDFAKSLARAQAAYEAQEPRYVDRVECGACDGHGKFGCTPQCIRPENATPEEDAVWQRQEELCMKNHTCPMKCNEGWIS